MLFSIERSASRASAPADRVAPRGPARPCPPRSHRAGARSTATEHRGVTGSAVPARSQDDLDFSHFHAKHAPVLAAGNHIGGYPRRRDDEIDATRAGRGTGRKKRAQPLPLGPDHDAIRQSPIDADLYLLEDARRGPATQWDFYQPRAPVNEDRGPGAGPASWRAICRPCPSRRSRSSLA